MDAFIWDKMIQKGSSGSLGFRIDVFAPYLWAFKVRFRSSQRVVVIPRACKYLVRIFVLRKRERIEKDTGARTWSGDQRENVEFENVLGRCWWVALPLLDLLAEPGT